jgi:hypothetical protein
MLREGVTAREPLVLHAELAGTAVVELNARCQDQIVELVRTIQVRPYGRKALSRQEILVGEHATAAIELSLPHSSITDSISGEVIVDRSLVPNLGQLMKQLLQPSPYNLALETDLLVPVLYLEYLQHASVEDAEAEAEARRLLEEALQRAVESQHQRGGFSQWPGHSPSIKLTAKVGMILRRADAFIPAAGAMAARAEDWLAGYQYPNGSWSSDRWQTTLGFPTRQLIVDAHSTRFLAGSTSTELKRRQHRSAAGRALELMEAVVDSGDDPFVLADLVAAATLIDRYDLAARARHCIADLAQEQAHYVYWETSYNRIETTAAAVASLLGDPEYLRLAQAGLGQLAVYLDYTDVLTRSSKPSAIAVMAVEALPRSADGCVGVGLVVDGRQTSSVLEPGSEQLAIDLQPWLRPGRNRFELILLGSGTVRAMAEATDYVPWSEPVEQQQLELSVTWSSTEGMVGDELSCMVEGGWRDNTSSGPLTLAIGLPPGAEPIGLEEFSDIGLDDGRLIIRLVRPMPDFSPIRVNRTLRFRLSIAGSYHALPSTLWAPADPNIRIDAKPLHFSIAERVPVVKPRTQPR